MIKKLRTNAQLKYIGIFMDAYGTMQKINKVLTIGSQSFVRGASSRSYNVFVGLCSGNNFIIPCEPLMLCRDSFFVSASRSTLQMSAS